MTIKTETVQAPPTTLDKILILSKLLEVGMQTTNIIVDKAQKKIETLIDEL